MRAQQARVTVDAPTKPAPLPHQRPSHLLSRRRPEGSIQHEACPIVLASVLGEPGLEQPRLDLQRQRFAVQVRHHAAQHCVSPTTVADAAQRGRPPPPPQHCLPAPAWVSGLPAPVAASPDAKQRLGPGDRDEVGEPSRVAGWRPDLGGTYEQARRGVGLTRRDQQPRLDQQHTRGQPLLLVRAGRAGQDSEVPTRLREVCTLQGDPRLRHLGVIGARARDPGQGSEPARPAGWRAGGRPGAPRREPVVPGSRPGPATRPWHARRAGTQRQPRAGFRSTRGATPGEPAGSAPGLAAGGRRARLSRLRRRRLDRPRGRDDARVSPASVSPDLDHGPAPASGHRRRVVGGRRSVRSSVRKPATTGHGDPRGVGGGQGHLTHPSRVSAAHPCPDLTRVRSGGLLRSATAGARSGRPRRGCGRPACDRPPGRGS